MTVIAAIVQDGAAYMAADRQVANGWTTHESGPKIRMMGEAIVGLSGAMRAAAYLRQHEPLVSPVVGLTPEMVDGWAQGLADGLHNWLGARGHGKVDDTGKIQGVVLLVATRLGVWRIDSDGACLRILSGEWACGSGEDFAIGVLFATKGSLPGKRLRTACEAAIAHNMGCGGPVDVLTLAAP